MENFLAVVLAHADEIDPMTTWRTEMAKAKAAHAGTPCPECGKIHGDEHRGE
jgi:hypothetical protein